MELYNVIFFGVVGLFYLAYLIARMIYSSKNYSLINLCSFESRFNLISSSLLFLLFIYSTIFQGTFPRRHNRDAYTVANDPFSILIAFIICFGIELSLVSFLVIDLMNKKYIVKNPFK